MNTHTADEFVPFVKQLVEQSKQSTRPGWPLDHSALYRYLNQGMRPNQDACIALAYYFQVHPNEMLQKAGYPPRAYFDLSLADPTKNKRKK